MAKIKDDDIELLRERADIVEIVSGFTQLKKAGPHTFKALCPFHSEKTPSFTVDTSRNLYHCLAAETGVITALGTFPIGKLAGDSHVLLTTGGKWVEAEIKSFGEQQLWEVKLTRNGRHKSLFATDGHRWFVRAGAGRRSSKEKVTKELKKGDRLLTAFARGRASLPGNPSPFGVAQGFTFGDGTRNRHYGSVANFDGNKDLEMLKFFPAAEPRTKGRTSIGGLPNFFKELPPLNESPAYLYGWLAGYFAADGCVSKDGQVILSSASKEALEFVRTLCNRLGIGTYGIKHQSRLGLGSQESDLFHLTFINSTVRPEFFLLSKHRERFESSGIGRTERPGWVVQSVEATDRVEEVFCAVVPETHAFALEDNVLTGNCFGCGEGGNVYQFVQKAENLPFPEAVEWVARRTGFELHYEEQRPGEAGTSNDKRRLLEANRIAAEFFHDTLMRNPDAAEARKYLGGRGFGREVAARWMLGYAPGRNALCRHLLSKGFTQEEILKADLGRMSDRDGSFYDTFRQRIIFTTWNLQDDVVAFGARALGDQQPKYLNTSETPVFSKSRMMYGLNRAKSAIARGSALVVEGYTDVIALHEAGITNAIATNGTALGQSHFELLKKFSSRIVLMFDADEAGKGAAEKGWGREEVPLSVRVGVEVLVAPVPAGSDPAELVQQDGPEAVNKVVENAQPLLEFKLDQLLGTVRLDTPEARSAAIRRAVEVLGWHPDPIARHEYVFFVAKRVGVEPEVVQRAMAESRSRPLATGGESRDRDRRLPGHVKVEREALRLLLTQGNAASVLSDIEERDFTAPARRELFTAAAELAKQGRSADSGLADTLTPDARTLFSELMMSVPDEPEEAIKERAHEVFVRLKVFTLEREIKLRQRTLQDMNPLEEAQLHDELFTQLVGLEAQRRDLLRLLQGAA